MIKSNNDVRLSRYSCKLTHMYNFDRCEVSLCNSSIILIRLYSKSYPIEKRKYCFKIPEKFSVTGKKQIFLQMCIKINSQESVDLER